MCSSQEASEVKPAVRQELVESVRKKLERSDLASDPQALKVVVDKLWPILTR